MVLGTVGGVGSALDALLEDGRWGEALDYNFGVPMPHETDSE
jgi:hypothetical protein